MKQNYCPLSLDLKWSLFSLHLCDEMEHKFCRSSHQPILELHPKTLMKTVSQKQQKLEYKPTE